MVRILTMILPKLSVDILKQYAEARLKQLNRCKSRESNTSPAYLTAKSEFKPGKLRLEDKDKNEAMKS
jgi:hypothetical protein